MLKKSLLIQIILITALLSTYSPPAKSFDWLSVAGTIFNWVKSKKAKTIKTESIRNQYIKHYNDTHEKAFEHINFLSKWQDVNTKAAALIIISERLLFVGETKNLKQHSLSLEAFKDVFTMKNAKTIKKHCDDLKKSAYESVSKTVKDTNIKRLIKKSADDLTQACSKLHDYREEVELNFGMNQNIVSVSYLSLEDSDKKDINEAFFRTTSEDGTIGLEPFIDDKNNLLFGNRQEIRPVESLDHEGRLADMPERNLVYSDELKKILEKNVILKLADNIKDIKHQSTLLQKITSEHLNDLFVSIQESQVAFLESIDKQAKDVAELHFPTKDWTTMVQEILDSLE